jgi:hypothetical protein
MNWSRFGALALLACTSGCSMVSSMFGAVLKHGVSGSTSSNPTVHCQTGPDGNPQCYEYRPGGPLRAGDPPSPGSDPNASIGESPNASAVAIPHGTAQANVPGPAWQAPMPLPPEPVPVPGR